MNDLAKRTYVGDGKLHYDPLDEAWSEPEPYIAGDELAEAVNVALHLRRPLLLEGDPGCGKTRLAYAVAYELGYPLKTCYIRSTSRAQDLLYEYDAVARLYDIQEQKTFGADRQPPPRDKYVTLGELGRAIELSEKGVPSVVLIDEIDKADIDFPNDLLQVLDRYEFRVKETEQRYDALRGESRHDRKAVLPLVIVTSNREKELPKPFLRRCLFFYIDFPKPQTLNQIVDRHFKSKAMSELFERAIQQFWALRRQEAFRWRKIPSTSELLDWLQILEEDEDKGKVTVQALATSPLSELPHLETLVKTQSDVDALRQSDG